VSAQRAPRSSSGEAQRVLDLLNSLGSTIFRQLLWQRASDLTYAQTQVLFYVAANPGCHMGDVAKAFGVTLPAVTQIVDRLEQRALMSRGDHPADRRIYLLDLTRAGRALAEELQALRLRGLTLVLGRMSPGSRRRVVVGLEALADAAAAAAEDVDAKTSRPRKEPR
jgi:DNA-binding MarR family transcriptional regulator